MFILTDISIAILIAAVINLFVLVTSWRRKRSRSGLYFALGMLGLFIWTLASALDYAAVSLELKILFAKIEAVGYHSALALFVMFAFSYAGNDAWLERNWGKILILSPSVSSILLTLTNELHGWIWAGFVKSGNNVVVFEHGRVFDWVILYGYLFIIIIFVNLWVASRKGSRIAQRQARTLMLVLLFPLATNLLYLLDIGGIEGVDWTTITFSVSGLLILRALYGTNLLDIVPIARDKLISSLSDGMIVLDLQNRVIDINQTAAGMFSANMIGKDLAQVSPLARTLLEQPPGKEIRSEVVTDEADRQYFDVLISPLYDGNRSVIGRLLIFRDITERKKIETRLLQLEQAVEQSPASVVITDRKGDITYVNPSFKALTGYTQGEVVGKNPRIIQSGETPPEVYQDMWQTILSGKPWRGELLNKKKNGDLYWEFEVIAPILDSEGNILNFISVKEDITERKHAEDALRQANQKLEKTLAEIEALQAVLREQAIRDSLTQMYNRRFLNETIEHEFHTADRLSQPLSLILLDIDHFKSINDSFGHSAGDACLVMLANLLKEHTRKSDVACRYGGEEFLLALQGASLDAAIQHAEKLRILFSNLTIAHEGREIKATISLGVASYPAHGRQYSEVISKADKALYISKNTGRNRVTVWSE
ncbi:MAG: hypothetical protein DPW18_07310 [Chloroflexi bacterium]|nr:hypothetical protein [Chloroflexota bacterium]MDL1941474.1 diguanylate cyclase [Chloroflexi bacterium CFX2]